MQTGTSSLHTESSLQTRSSSCDKLYPGLQEYLATEPGVVEALSKWTFPKAGFESDPQSVE